MHELAHGGLGMATAMVCGLSVGSYSNVVIHRAPREGTSSLNPARSMCPSCSATLAWYDNIPVVSWLMLRGKCRSCSAPISARYPAVELLVGLLFTLAWWMLPPVDLTAAAVLGVAWYLAATWVIVTWIDVEYLIIPDSITYTGMGLGVVTSTALPSLHTASSLYRPESPHLSGLVVSVAGILAGAGTLLVISLLGNAYAKWNGRMRERMDEAGIDDAMGFGDVKLLGLGGAFLGPTLALDAFFVAALLGSVVGVAMIVWSKLRKGDGVLGLPFGPFLGAALLVEVAQPLAAWNFMQQMAGPVAG